MLTLWLPLLAVAILIGLGIAVFFWLVFDDEEKDQTKDEWEDGA
jgi:hypothetical protein